MSPLPDAVCIAQVTNPLHSAAHFKVQTSASFWVDGITHAWDQTVHPFLCWYRELFILPPGRGVKEAYTVPLATPQAR
jgi:hypothetical protein